MFEFKETFDFNEETFDLNPYALLIAAFDLIVVCAETAFKFVFAFVVFVIVEAFDVLEAVFVLGFVEAEAFFVVHFDVLQDDFEFINLSQAFCQNSFS